MQLDDLISKLLNLRTKHGNIPVMKDLDVGDDVVPVSEPEFCEGKSMQDAVDDPLPEKFLMV